MKRLPGKFVVVNHHYCFKNKYTVNIFKFGGKSGHNRYWQFVSTQQHFFTIRDAKKYGKLLAKQYRIGYIYGIHRGQKYQRKHRTSMILYDRDESLNLKPGGDNKWVTNNSLTKHVKKVV